jgi:hypothetical protein
MILQNIIYYKEPEIISNSQLSWNLKPNTIEEQQQELKKALEKTKLAGITEGSFVKTNYSKLKVVNIINDINNIKYWSKNEPCLLEVINVNTPDKSKPSVFALNEIQLVN